MKKRSLFVIVLVIFITSCKKKDKEILHTTYPPCTTCPSCAASGNSPLISYSGFTIYGNPDSAELKINFCDKDGDIGLSTSDTTNLFKQGNLWMIYYYLDTAGHWTAYDIDPATPKIDTFFITYRIPALPAPPITYPYTHMGYPNPVTVVLNASSILEGTIQMRQKPYFVIHHTIRYDIYMYDKAHNKSNVISTDTIHQ